MEIFWTKRAEDEYNAIKRYIHRKLGSAAAQKFKLRVMACLTVLEGIPEIGGLMVPQKGIRSFRMTPLTRLFYRIDGNRIVLISFFDVRRNPEKRP